ncbi:MAG: recombination protein NinG [Colwellia sp.]|nr:recombination protein NinG [Colwellia sp.]
MANSKRKCLHCKEYVTEWVKLPVGVFCNRESAIKWSTAKRVKDNEKAIKKRESEQKKKNVAFKSKYYADDVKTRKAAAKKACHEYIRLRDKDKPCICCGKPLGDEYHAGHYHESGNNPKVRYDEDNIHGQRVDCNYFKGGDSGDYKENLIARIGAERVNILAKKKTGSLKRTAQDYSEIETYFKNKLKDLAGS